jgi:transposase
MSPKSIVRKESKVLTNSQKVACLRTKYFVFRQRLEFKCKERGNVYKLVNEKYTSKTCSYCGEYKENLGGNKIYECDYCLTQIDRDVNGARNIYFNGQ